MSQQQCEHCESRTAVCVLYIGDEIVGFVRNRRLVVLAGDELLKLSVLPGPVGKERIHQKLQVRDAIEPELQIVSLAHHTRRCLHSG